MNLGGPFEFLERPDEDPIRLTMCRYLKFHPEEISSVNSDLQHEQELTEIIQNGLETPKPQNPKTPELSNKVEDIIV